MCLVFKYICRIPKSIKATFNEREVIRRTNGIVSSDWSVFFSTSVADLTLHVNGRGVVAPESLPLFPQPHARIRQILSHTAGNFPHACPHRMGLSYFCVLHCSRNQLSFWSHSYTKPYSAHFNSLNCYWFAPSLSDKYRL